MKISLALIFITVNISALGQKKIDYMKIREEIRPPLCGIRDSLATTEVYEKLLALDTNTIRKNLGQYYDDKLEMEYLLSMYRHDSTMMRKSAESAEKLLYHKPNSSTGLWSAFFCYSMLGECEKAAHYLTLYIDRVPERYRSDQGQIDRLKAFCPE